MPETSARKEINRVAPLARELTAVGADRGATRLLGAALIVAFYYLSYRYPLQINSSTTSPSYSDTPTWLQVAKYGLFALLMGAGFVYFGVSRSVARFERVRVPPAITLLAAFAASWPLAQAALFRRADLVETGVFLAYSVLLLAVAPLLDVKPLIRITKAFVVLSVVVNVVQIALYVVNGRLPALAYAGTTSIRFGSIWDDPNGFAIVIALLLPIAWLSFRRGRVLTVLLLTASLALSQSVTGVVATLTGFAIVWLLQLRLSSSWLPAFLVVVLVAGAVEFASLSSSPVVATFLQGKAGSVQGHLDAITVFRSLQVQQFLGFAPITTPVESGYVDLVGTEGILFAILYVVMLVALAAKSHRNGMALQKKDPRRGLHFGISAFSIAVIIGLTNLPLHSVFPVNALVAVCLVIAFCVPNQKDALQ